MASERTRPPWNTLLMDRRCLRSDARAIASAIRQGRQLSLGTWKHVRKRVAELLQDETLRGRERMALLNIYLAAFEAAVEAATAALEDEHG